MSVTTTEVSNTHKIIKHGHVDTLWTCSESVHCKHCGCIYNFDENDVIFIDTFAIRRLSFRKPYGFVRHVESIIRCRLTNKKLYGIHCPECNNLVTFRFSKTSTISNIVRNRIKSRIHYIKFQYYSNEQLTYTNVLTCNDFECIEIFENKQQLEAKHDYYKRQYKSCIAYRCRKYGYSNIILFPDQLQDVFKKTICTKNPTECIFEHFVGYIDQEENLSKKQQSLYTMCTNTNGICT